MPDCVYAVPEVDHPGNSINYVCLIGRFGGACPEDRPPVESQPELRVCPNRVTSNSRQVILNAGKYRYHGNRGAVIADVVIAPDSRLIALEVRHGMKLPVRVMYHEEKSIEALRNACNRALEVIGAYDYSP